MDEPSTAVSEADRLVVRMMREAGYPVDAFAQRAKDISVDHPEAAQSYRTAQRIAVASSQGLADTEDLRQAVTAYRRLADVLIDDPGDNHHADHHAGRRAAVGVDRDVADRTSVDRESANRQQTVLTDRTEQS